MSLPSRSISTDSFPGERRAEMWNELVARKLLRIQWEVPEGVEFKATMAPVLCAGEVEIVNMALGPFASTNAPEHARQKEHRLSLHILTGGQGVVAERGTEQMLLHKTMGVFLDEGRTYRLSSPSELTRGFILMLPKARLIDAVPALPDLMEAPLDVSSGPFRLLQSYLNLFHAGVDMNDPSLVRLNADYILDLIALMFRARDEAQDAARQRGLPQTRTAIILAEVERNLADPKLSGKTVAGRVGITERYLQQLMEARGETFSHHLLRLRLDKAAGMLTAKRMMRISEVAFQCGFNDLSYFNRSFRKRFGESPRGYRR